jgi:KDO2-lipid IV(A) lauroyltransferase
MQRLTYILTLPFIHLISRLPFPVLYGLSDFLCVVVYRIIGYRRKVVSANLAKSFPELRADQRKMIERLFYSYFCDLVLETMKLLTISKRSLLKRVDVSGLNVIEGYARAGRSVIVAMGHTANWEFACAALARHLDSEFHVIYHPLSNPYFDSLLYKMRTRHTTILHPMDKAIQRVLRAHGKVTVTAFVADQTPPPQTAFWTWFLEQETPFFQGLGKLAVKLNRPVVFVSVIRVGRGRYRLEEEVLTDQSANYPVEEVLRRYAASLQINIHDQPADWLWTHRRWKHKRLPNQELIE